MGGKMKLSMLLLIIPLFINSQTNTLPEGYPETDRTKTNINIGWKFHLGSVAGNPESLDFDDSDWKKVSVPHTLELVSYEMDSVGESWVQKKYLRDVGWYRKKIKIPSTSKGKVFLEFEGVHNATELWVNGKKVGENRINGYVPFHFDITDYVIVGKENLVAIKADNRFDKNIAPDPHRTDYIKFSGIYRDVYVVTTNKLHVTFNWEKFDAGVHITTPTVNKKNGTVSIKTTVANENNVPKKCSIKTSIIDAKGYVIKKITKTVTILPNTDHTFRQTTSIEDAYHQWSVDDPYLYRVNSIIYENDKAVDFVENRFGFRTFQLEYGKGFMLNDEPIFLIGVNRHQNYPNIGDAVPNSFHYNEALQYKKAGMNIIRLSHYTQDDAFIEACDELGMIVYEEPSTWIEWGDEIWFDNLEAATRTMIRNHRNHPSIVFWGAGINHRGPVPRMQHVAKEEDPFRLTASAASPWNGIINAGITDVYATMDYRRTEFTESDFEMVMEHGSSPDAEVNQFHISRYKGSKQNIAAIAWLGADYNHLMKRDERWGRDYMTNYAVLSAYRVPKPVYYWYQSELVKQPMVHIADQTASKEGKVRVYSNCQEVWLYHNDLLIAKQRPDNHNTKVHLEHPSYTFQFNWKAGTLKAVGYNNGIKITEHTRSKEAIPHHIEIRFNIEDTPFYAGGSDLRMVHAAIVDKNGEVVTTAKQKVQFSISGEGEIVDNGKIYANPATVYNGIASIYIRGTERPGTITIEASAKGIKSRKVSINTKSFIDDEIQRSALPIYDYPILKLDIGGKGQLVEHGWKEWSGNSDKELSYNDRFFNKVTLQISSQDPVNWHPNSAITGDLGFVAADGIHTKNKTFQLKINNLPTGDYILETFHQETRKNSKIVNKIEVIVEDTNGKFIKKADDYIVAYYNTKSTGERKPFHIKTAFSASSANPVMITFKNLEDKGHMWLNGIVLKKKK